MNKILKYELTNLDTGALQEVDLPQGARILAVQVQVNQEVFKAEVGHGFGPAKAYGPITETVCLWAMSNTDESRKVRRMFRIYGTGKPVEDPLDELDYIGTVQTGPLVWHIFERKAPPPRCQRCGEVGDHKYGHEGADLVLCPDCRVDWQYYADRYAVTHHEKPPPWGDVFHEFLKTKKGAK